MKIVYKLYGRICFWVFIVSVVVFLVAMARTSHHDLAENPHKVAQIVKIELPNITHIESTNNHDRGTSRRDVYTHRCTFTNPLDGDTIHILDELCITDSTHWRKESATGCYIYSDDGGIDQLYSVTCNIYCDHLFIEYMVDEAEGIFLFLPFAIVYVLLFRFGCALSVIAIVRKIFCPNSNNKAYAG